MRQAADSVEAMEPGNGEIFEASSVFSDEGGLWFEVTILHLLGIENWFWLRPGLKPFTLRFDLMDGEDQYSSLARRGGV